MRQGDVCGLAGADGDDAVDEAEERDGTKRDGNNTAVGQVGLARRTGTGALTKAHP